MRLKLTIEYDGTGFRGWARQPGARTVEGELRRALGRALYGPWASLAVAGRTDTGVHALANVVSVDVEGGPPADRAAEALNAALPDDVAVVRVRAGAGRLHARFDARSPLVSLPRLAAPRALGARGEARAVVAAAVRRRQPLTQSAQALLGEHDFRAFTPTETRHGVFARMVEQVRWVELDEDVAAFEITADSFLRHMVRTLVGTMLEGRELAPLLDGRPRTRPARPRRRTACTSRTSSTATERGAWLRSARALSRSSSSISTAPWSTPARSSSRRCATPPRPCSAATTATPS